MFVRIVDDQIFEHKTGSTLIDAHGVSHPWNIVELWPESDLARLDLYNVEPWTLPPGKEAVGEPFFIFENGKVTQRCEVRDVPVPKIEPPASPTPPTPPTQSSPAQPPVVEPPFPILLQSSPGSDVGNQKVLKQRAVVIEALGYFGNIWVRQLTLPKRGDYHQGHRHNYDHITLVAHGSVLCEVENCAPKIFASPTFITIKADDWHKFTAMEEGTVYYCIYALRDVEGEVIRDIYDIDKHSPYLSVGETNLTPQDIEKIKKMSGCQHCQCG